MVMLDKIIAVKFNCDCGKESFIKADKSCRFATYMQCCYCNAYIYIYAGPLSYKVEVKIMNKKEIDWLATITERAQNTSTPLRIYRTKQYAF